MPTNLPIPSRRRPWPGQRLCFVLIAIAGAPIIGLALMIVALLAWLCPDDWS